ncbi:MAG: SOS response-associated peptidase [Bacteroidia bacterium]|nr:SOS response-associated peptidase [Bacteroidia bacterium]
MCGRYSFAQEEALAKRIKVKVPAGKWRADYNVSPMKQVPVVRKINQALHCDLMQWGLLPAFSGDEKSAVKMMNARSETLGEKPAFRNLIQANRCLIPADGFYEFEKHGKTKRPVRYEVNGTELFFFAGLYSLWTNPSNPNDRRLTCTVITTEPNSLVSKVHDRMPLILPPETEISWLDENLKDYQSIRSFLVPFPAERMRSFYVHPDINKTSCNAPELIQPYHYPEEWTLF